MRKITVLFLVVALMVSGFGCASIYKAERLNGLDLTVEGKSNVGHYFANNWGIYLLPLPLITGDTDKVSEVSEGGATINMTFLKDTVTLDCVVDMLTRSIAADGATAVEDMTSKVSSFYLFPIFVFKSVSVSASGVK